MTPLRAALREASLLHPLSALSVLFLAPVAIAPYLALLAVDASGRVAADAAYFIELVAVHALAIQFGVATRLPDRAAGYADVMRLRGLAGGRWLAIRAAANVIRLLAPAAAVVAGCCLGARLGGSRDAARLAVASLGAAESFGIAVLAAAILPRPAAAIAAAAIVFFGHIPASGGALASLLPAYDLFDFWPGAALSASAAGWLALRSILYAAGASAVGAAIVEARGA